MSVTDKSSKRLPAAIGAGTDWVEEEELALRLHDHLRGHPWKCVNCIATAKH